MIEEPKKILTRKIPIMILKGVRIVVALIVGFIVFIIVTTYISFNTEWKSKVVFSPSRNYAIIATVDRPNSAKVIIHLLDKDKNELDKLITPASDVMKWATGWDKNNRIIMYSSDTGTVYIWNILNEKLMLVDEDQEGTQRAKELMRDKYGEESTKRI